MTTTIRDSIHKNIPVSDMVRDLLDTPPLQRLRRVRQLGGAYLVYPGANHTRFEHSLGAAFLAARAAESLRLDERERHVLTAAALLHDVGHAPFSHTSDDVLRDHGLRHEDLSVDRITWTVLNDVLQRHGVAAREVADAVRGRGPFGALVAGDIDVDRMDYLVRDAHYTGVAVSVDVDRLVTLFRVVDGHLALDEKAVHTAEALLLDRFLMYPTVYLHHTCRAVETMLVGGMRDLLARGTSVKEFAAWDDARLLERMRAAGGTAAEVVERLENRDLPKRAWEGAARDLETSPTLARAATDSAARRRLERELAEGAGLEPGRVLLDVPRPPRFREVGARVATRDGGLVRLSEVSTLVANLERARMDHWRWWVFAPYEHAQRVASAVPDLFGLRAAP